MPIETALLIGAIFGIATYLLLKKNFIHILFGFVILSNGANLFINESGLHGVGVASTNLIRELEQEELEHYTADALRRYAIFARVNGGGDFLVFDLETGQVLDGVHAEQPHEWRPIAASFTHWLESFIEASGRYYWLEALYSSVPDA